MITTGKRSRKTGGTRNDIKRAFRLARSSRKRERGKHYDQKRRG